MAVDEAAIAGLDALEALDAMAAGAVGTATIAAGDGWSASGRLNQVATTRASRSPPAGAPIGRAVFIVFIGAKPPAAFGAAPGARRKEICCSTACCASRVSSSASTVLIAA